jgi:hypothetical protein
MDQLRQFALSRYQSWWARNKTLAFAKAFLKYLTRVPLDTRYQTFELFLEMPKVVRARKRVTNRIVTKKDIENGTLCPSAPTAHQCSAPACREQIRR